MKAIAGAIVVLAGAMLMGLSGNDIPINAWPKIFSIALIVIGLIVLLIQLPREKN